MLTPVTGGAKIIIPIDNKLGPKIIDVSEMAMEILRENKIKGIHQISVGLKQEVATFKARVYVIENSQDNRQSVIYGLVSLVLIYFIGHVVRTYL